MAAATQARDGQTHRAGGIVRVNGADLYHEVRGAGPPALFIAGMTGDAGHFERVAELLADEFTVVTYDRRGNSRSPRPAGWQTTSIEEQADDAAWLLRALDLAPAAVFGTSLGAVIALDLCIRHAPVVRGALLHETGLFSALARPDEIHAMTQPTVARGLAAGGPRGGVEALWRLAAGDGTFEALDQQLRERMLGNAEVALKAEAPCLTHRPDEAGLAAVRLPVHVLTAAEGHAFFAEIAARLAARLRADEKVLPGRHAAYLDRPRAFADAVRPLLRLVSAHGAALPSAGSSAPARR